MHGTYTANMAIYESDLLISIGARFDDRVTGNLKHFAPNAKLLTLTSTQRKWKECSNQDSNCWRCKRSIKAIASARRRSWRLYEMA